VRTLKVTESVEASVQTERLSATFPSVAYRTRMLVVLALGWATLQCGRFLLPPLLPRIQQSLAISAARAGLSLTAFGLVNFFPTMLVARGLSEALAGGTFALLFVAGLLVKPTAGEISDRLPRTAVSVAGLFLAAGGLAVILLGDSLVPVAAGTVLTAVGYKTQFPIADSVVIGAAPEGSVGAELGAARAVFLLANALGPGVVGVVAELTDFTVAFWLLAALFALAALVFLRQRISANV